MIYASSYAWAFPRIRGPKTPLAVDGPPVLWDDEAAKPYAKEEDVAVNAIGTARNLGVGGLLAVAAVHANWATGSSWPLPDRRRLARAVVGNEEMPSATACLAVAALMTVAAGLVAGFPRRAPRLGGLGAAGVVATLAARGLVGAVGLTPGLVPEQRVSGAFARWDRHLYSPLCLLLAGLCAAGIYRR